MSSVEAGGVSIEGSSGANEGPLTYFRSQERLPRGRNIEINWVKEECV